MTEKDALSTFDFSKVVKPGLFLKFKPGESVVVRVLSTDPFVYNDEFKDRSGELVVNTRFAWVVYNFSDSLAQIMQTTPNLAKRIGELHTDVDFGANIRKIDLKITPPEKGEIKAYEVQVLPKTKDLTNEQIQEAQAIDLAKALEDKNGGRLSLYEPKNYELPSKQVDEDEAHTPGVSDAQPETDEGESSAAEEVLGGEPINLDDIPF